MAISPGGRPADASPTGKKGGTRGLTDYLREVVHALKRKGVPEGLAIAIARSQQAKWAAKSKNPAIRAASVKSLAEQHVLDHRKRGGKADMSRTATKARPGSIPSGVGKGKFPITNQHSLESAIKLRKHAKGVSQATVVAHIKAEAKKRGLKIPKTASLSVPAFATLRGAGGGGNAYQQEFFANVDLDWSSFDANRPAGQQQSAATPPPPDLLSAQTHKNIAAFQKAHGLPVTGQLDAGTVAWLNNPKNSSAATKAAATTAKKNAAAATKAQKAAASAAKKATAAQTKVEKQQATQASAAQKASAKQAAANQVATTKAGKAAIGYGLSNPIVSSNDGVRMTSNLPFGGKKAAPFVKGGGRAKKKNVRALNMENLKRAQKVRMAK